MWKQYQPPSEQGGPRPDETVTSGKRRAPYAPPWQPVVARRPSNNEVVRKFAAVVGIVMSTVCALIGYQLQQERQQREADEQHQMREDWDSCIREQQHDPGLLEPAEICEIAYDRPYDEPYYDDSYIDGNGTN